MLIPIADERVGVQVKTVRSLENTYVPYLSASEVVIHDEALYQMYVHLPLSGEFVWCLGLGRACSVLVCSQSQVFLSRVNSAWS